MSSHKRRVKRVSKRRQEEAKAGSPAWMATFSDLMNLLLCFFVMLFSMSTVDADAYEELKQSFKNDYTSFLDGGMSFMDNSSANDEPAVTQNQFSANGVSDDEYEKVENLEESIETIEQQKALYSEKMYEEMGDLLEEQELDSGIVSLDVDEDNNYIVLTLSGSLLFDSGETQLKEDALSVLSKVGDVLMMYAGYQIEIVGHTDNVPVTSNNHSYKDNNELSTDRALSTFYYLVNEKGLDPANMKFSGRGEYDPVASNETEAGRKQNRRVEIKIYNELARY